MFDFEFLTPYIEIIFPVSLIIAIMLLLVPVMDKRYVAKARYFVWLIIAIRLLIPFDIWHGTDTQHLINADLPNFAIVRNDVLDYIEQQEDIAENNIAIDPSRQLEKPAFAAFPRIVLHSVIEWVWSLGSIGLLLYFTVQYIYTKAKMKKLSLPDNNGQETLDRLCREMNINHRLKIYRCSCINTAMIMGIVFPVIFVPDIEMTDDMQEMMLRHELTHYKRKDILYKFVLMLACCMHWFNPLVWLMDRQAQKDVEICCDDDVINGKSEEFRQLYSDSILEMVKAGVIRKTAFSTYFSMDKTALAARFKNIYDTTVKKSGRTVTAGILALCLSSTLLISCTGSSSDDYLSKTASILSNNNRNIFIAEDADYVYFKDAVKIKNMNKSDETVTELYTFDATIYEIPTDLEYFDSRLYIFTSLGEVVSMDTNGENIKKAKLPAELMLSSVSVSKGIYNNQLYYFQGDTYKIDPETLEFEKTERVSTGTRVASDGSVWIRTTENNVGRLYRTDENGEPVLFTEESESVWSSHMTNSYMFYCVWENGDMSKYFIYRADISGENKTLIKEVELNDVSFRVTFDNSYIYLPISKTQLVKIHKETLKETDISVSAQSYITSLGEVCDGKLFETLNSCYYVDLDTGKKVNLSSYWDDSSLNPIIITQ
ncbi:MAG: hypothetical protein IJ362_09520 [Oscillospiraceae bacterium]|nr:hypothetical protein [Oscillospiraceae bacterium]